MFRNLIILGVIAACWAAPQRYERDVGGRIVNGTDAKDGQYPFQVSLRYIGSHSCGGSIIDANNILTAAHCIAGRSTSLLTIEYGATVLGKGNVIAVAECFPHLGYKPSNTYIHDIAVLKLASPIPLGDGLAEAVKLPQQLEDTPGGTPATVIGWGLPYTGGSVTPHLQTVDIAVVSDEQCLAAHSAGGMYPHPSNICAGVDGGGKGQCNGDSGGPLLANGQQVGIVSWSRKPCTIAPYPGVFTEVSYYIDWISEITGARGHLG